MKSCTMSDGYKHSLSGKSNISVKWPYRTAARFGFPFKVMSGPSTAGRQEARCTVTAIYDIRDRPTVIASIQRRGRVPFHPAVSSNPITDMKTPPPQPQQQPNGCDDCMRRACYSAVDCVPPHIGRSDWIRSTRIRLQLFNGGDEIDRIRRRRRSSSTG